MVPADYIISYSRSRYANTDPLKICTSHLVGVCLSRPVAAAEAYPGARVMSPYPEKPISVSEKKTTGCSKAHTDSIVSACVCIGGVGFGYKAQQLPFGPLPTKMC